MSKVNFRRKIQNVKFKGKRLQSTTLLKEERLDRCFIAMILDTLKYNKCVGAGKALMVFNQNL